MFRNLWKSPDFSFRGLNYESGLKQYAGLNLKAIDNGPKMVTMDRNYTKVWAEPQA